MSVFQQFRYQGVCKRQGPERLKWFTKNKMSHGDG